MDVTRRSRLGVVPLVVLGCCGVILTAATWAAFRYRATTPAGELPVLGTVPQFTLVASTGQPVSRQDLAGRVWIADFIFTRCGSTCPVLTAHMARLQTALARAGAAGVRLVSFSVDPAYDTPAVLRDYAARFHADPHRWLFLTGSRAALYTMMRTGFHLAVGDAPANDNSDDAGLITHSDRVVLVDADGNIRGYYDGTDPNAVQQVLHAVQNLPDTTWRSASEQSP